MNPLLLFATVLLMISNLSLAQQIPVIKAGSARADIRDGLHFRKGFWIINPEKRPDRYYVELPRKEHRVFFYTDIDSISFDIAYGGVYDFLVLLNNKDSCHIQIIAAPESVYNIKSDHHPDRQTPDTIPFYLGSNNKIYIKGRVNQSDSLNFQFDLGSTYASLKSTSNTKAKINFDSSGNDQEKISNNNRLDIAGVHWDSIGIHQNDHGMTDHEDGLLGNFLFQNKILEINYDRKWIIIHDTLPAMDTGYSRHEVIMNGSIPMLQASLATRDTSCTTWFIFDTGDSGNGWIDDSTATRYQLYRGVNKVIRWGDRIIVKLPELRIANLSFFNVSATLEKKGAHSRDMSLLGNSLLKRFNVILDNREGFIYMKPNSLMKEPYDNTLLMIYGSITAAILVLILLVIIVVMVVRKRNRRRIDAEPWNLPPET